MASKLSTYAAFIDFKKAFDLVDRDALMHRLLEEGIDGNIYNITKQLYSNTSSCINIDNMYTEWFITTKGVRQAIVCPQHYLQFLLMI